MTMRAKTRPSLDGGFVKLQRRLLRRLRVDLDLSPELSFFYIQLLAAAKYSTDKRHNKYPGTLGNADPAAGSVAEWSARDVAACCFVTEPTARRNIGILRKAGLLRRCSVPGFENDPNRHVWQLETYNADLADDT